MIRFMLQTSPKTLLYTRDKHNKTVVAIIEDTKPTRVVVCTICKPKR